MPDCLLTPRVSCRLDGQLFNLEALDISEGGMFLGKLAEATVGQELNLEFPTPPSPHPLTPRAKVAHKDSQDLIGVQFLALGFRELEAIQEYLSARITE